MATVLWTAEAREEFDKLPGAIQPRIERLLERLEKWPDVSGCKSLSRNLAGQHRLRTGDYRLQFTVSRDDDDWRIVINKVGHRDGFYG